MSAAPIGCSFEGARLERPRPWSVLLPYAWVRWPGLTSAPSGEVLRGAVVQAMGREAAHIDLHHHLGDGSTVQAPATVCYRPDPARVFFYGPRALEHAADVGDLRRMRVGADLVDLGHAEVTTGQHEVQVSGRQWFAYQTVTPLSLPERWWRRDPKRRAQRAAWLGLVVQRSVVSLLEHLGIDEQGMLGVHVERVERTRVQIKGATEPGYHCRFVTNADLPDGVPIGKHRAFGFGEVRRCR